MPRPRPAPSLRVALAVADAAMRSDVARVLAQRGIAPALVEPAEALAGDGLVGLAPGEPLGVAAAAELAPRCAAAAAAGTPMVLLVPAPRSPGSRADLQTAAAAFLAAHGAILCRDPDVWLETLVLLAGFGLPPGPRTAVVAPSGSWLHGQALALGHESELVGGRQLHGAARDDRGPTDVVLCDRATLAEEPRAKVLVVPVLPRGELAGAAPALVGLRAALAAVEGAGLAARRIAEGLGPAPLADVGPLGADRERFERQLARLGRRAGDHETKVLLAAYKVPVTRQAVATTPSAATRLAKRAGYPVELKPWGADVPSELEGCPVEHRLDSAAEVRRAFVAIGRALEQPAGVPVIVREAPPAGRELRVRFERIAELGWTVLVDVAGASATLAAPAPLRPGVADELTLGVEASREGDPTPDRARLADLLLRVSFLVACEPRIVRLELPRVIAAARGDAAIVVDARAELADREPSAVAESFGVGSPDDA